MIPSVLGTTPLRRLNADQAVACALSRRVPDRGAKRLREILGRCR